MNKLLFNSLGFKVCALLVLLIVSHQNLDAQITQEAKMIPGEVLILPTDPEAPVAKARFATLDAVHEAYNAQIKSLSNRFKMELWKVEEGQEEALINIINSSGLGLTAMRNYSYPIPAIDIKPSNTPQQMKTSISSTNDPRINEQYALEIMNVPEAWNISKGSRDVIVVVMDSGIDTEHSDLRNNIWVNPGEIPNNGIDDDGNGYVDDIHGWDAHNDSGNLYDLGNHGTHVAGIIGAEGSNGIGISGINQAIKMIGINASIDGRSISTAATLAAYEYITMLLEKDLNVVAVNMSFGGPVMHPINLNWTRYYATSHSQNNCIWVAAAGNASNNLNNDQVTINPAEIQTSNILTVASTDRYDNLSEFSNYGRYQVELAAPGTDILSTVPNNGYEFIDGTSMAAPYVTGLIALRASVYPNEHYSARIARIMATGINLPTLSNTTISGNRINAYWALANDWGSAFYGAAVPTLARFKPTDNYVGFSTGIINQTGSAVTLNDVYLSGTDAHLFKIVSSTDTGPIPKGGAIGTAIELKRVLGQEFYFADIIFSTSAGSISLPIGVDTYNFVGPLINLSEEYENLGSIQKGTLVEDKFYIINEGVTPLQFNFAYQLESSQIAKEVFQPQKKKQTQPRAILYAEPEKSVIHRIYTPNTSATKEYNNSNAIIAQNEIDWIFDTSFELDEVNQEPWLAEHSSGTPWEIRYVEALMNGQGYALTTGDPLEEYEHSSYSRAISPLIELKPHIEQGKQLAELRFDYALALEPAYDKITVDLIDEGSKILANLIGSDFGLTNDGAMHHIVIPLYQFSIKDNFRLRFTFESDLTVSLGFGGVIDNISIGVSDEPSTVVYANSHNVPPLKSTMLNYMIDTKLLSAGDYTFNTAIYSNAINDPQSNGVRGAMLYQSVFNLLPVDAPTEVTLKLPENNVENVNSSISFEWFASDNANNYSFILSAQEDLSDPIYMLDTLATNISIQDLDLGTTYYWQVTPSNIGGEGAASPIWSFSTKEPFSRSVVTMISPLDEAQNIKIPDSLSWTALSSVDSYEIQLSEQPDFQNRFHVDEITQEFYQIPERVLSDATTYFWRVRAQYGSELSSWSQTWSFVTELRTPETPDWEPANEQQLGGNSVLLKWNPSTRASTYNLELSEDPSFDSIFQSQDDIANTEFRASELAFNTIYYWRVQASNASGRSSWSNPRSFTTGNLTSIEEQIPTETSLQQNYPNPFNPSTQIRFSLAESSLTTLDIYSIDGTKVASLVNQVLNAGWHTATFNAANLPTGLYLYRLNTSRQQITKKMLLMK